MGAGKTAARAILQIARRIGRDPRKVLQTIRRLDALSAEKAVLEEALAVVKQGGQLSPKHKEALAKLVEAVEGRRPPISDGTAALKKQGRVEQPDAGAQSVTIQTPGVAQPRLRARLRGRLPPSTEAKGSTARGRCRRNHRRRTSESGILMVTATSHRGCSRRIVAPREPARWGGDTRRSAQGFKICDGAKRELARGLRPWVSLRPSTQPAKKASVPVAVIAPTSTIEDFAGLAQTVKTLPRLVRWLSGQMDRQTTIDSRKPWSLEIQAGVSRVSYDGPSSNQRSVDYRSRSIRRMGCRFWEKTDGSRIREKRRNSLYWAIGDYHPHVTSTRLSALAVDLFHNVATTFPKSPRHAKAALLFMDPATGHYTGLIRLQINPSQLTRTLKVRGAGAEGGDRSEAMRLTGPPVETMKVEAELDATDKLESPDENEDAVEFGLRPELAALESMVYPSSALLQENHERSMSGMLEILPVETPLILFGWGKNRLLPVRITELSVTEEAFDQELNPIRAKGDAGHAGPERQRSALRSPRRHDVSDTPSSHRESQREAGRRCPHSNGSQKVARCSRRPAAIAASRPQLCKRRMDAR